MALVTKSLVLLARTVGKGAGLRVQTEGCCLELGEHPNKGLYHTMSKLVHQSCAACENYMKSLSQEATPLNSHLNWYVKRWGDNPH